MTNFRALCAELHAAFNTYAVDMAHHDLLERTRAALAEQPSLKKLAMEVLERSCFVNPVHENIIRLALEQLDD